MPVYEYQGKHYEMSETDPVAAKAKIQSAIGEKPSAKEQPTSKPVMERMFGEGPSPEMGPLQRVERVAKSGLGGMAAGGGIGAGVGALAGGVGAVPGAATGAIIGGIGGVLGEIGEQVSAAYGGGRGTQVLTGLVAGTPAGEISKLGAKAVDISIAAGRGLFGKSSVLQEIQNILHPEQSATTAEARRIATEQARQRMAGADQQRAAEESGKAIQDAVRLRQERAAALAARSEKGKMGETTALRRQQDLANQELKSTVEQGVGGTKSPYDFGTQLRQDIAGVQDPIHQKMTNDYRQSYNAAMENASASESQGNFWASDTGAKEVRSKWIDIANKSSAPIKAEIKSIIDDIWKPIVNEEGKVVGFKPLPSTGVDQVIRRLGEASAKDVEGYAAIKGTLAGELRADLAHGLDKEGVRAGGFYDWSGLGPAKQAYAKSLEDLSRFESTRGSTALEKQLGVDLYKADAEKLPKTFFGSESGFREFSNMVGGPEKAAKYAEQYVRNEFSGKDIPALRKWISEHDFLMEVPQVRELALNQLNKLSSIENKSAILGERLSLAGEKTWSSQVDKFAQKWVKELGLEGPGGLPKDPSLVVSDILGGKFTSAQLKAISKYANDIPGIRQTFPGAVADYFSRLSPDKMAKELARVKPALEGSGLISPNGIRELEVGVNDIIAASKKVTKKGIPEEVMKLFRSKFSLATGVGGAAGGMATAESMKSKETEE